MKKLLAGLTLAAACLACSGCFVLATIAAVGAVATTTVKTSGKAAAPTAGTEGHAAPAAPASSGGATVLSPESAAQLSRPGQVVIVDGSNGSTTNLPWKDGMTLGAAASTGKAGAYGTATIFRDGRLRPVDLRQSWTADLALFAGDVVELRR